MNNWKKCKSFFELCRLGLRDKKNTPWGEISISSPSVSVKINKIYRLSGLVTEVQEGKVEHHGTYELKAQKAYVDIILDKASAYLIYKKLKDKYHICIFQQNKPVKTNLTRTSNPNMVMILHKNGQLSYERNFNIKANRSIELLKPWTNIPISKYYTVTVCDRLYGKNRIFNDIVGTLSKRNI